MQAIASDAQDLVTSTLQAIGSLVQTIGNGVSAVATAATIPSEAARQTVGLLDSIVGQAYNLELQFDAVPYGGLDYRAQQPGRFGDVVGNQQAITSGMPVGTYGGVSQLTFSQRMAQAGTAKAVIRSTRKLRSAALQLRARIATLLQDTLAGTIVARDGENLREISTRFYGSPHEWRQLMVFNGLSSPVLSAGDVVMVPRSAGGDLC